MTQYFGEFDNRLDVACAFQEGTGQPYHSETYIPHDTFPTDKELLVASYELPGYEGYAFVLFQRDGKLYEVNASHCSCYGLEDGWDPEETSWSALLMRKDTSCSGITPEVMDAIKVLAAQTATGE